MEHIEDLFVACRGFAFIDKRCSFGKIGLLRYLSFWQLSPLKIRFQVLRMVRGSSNSSSLDFPSKSTIFGVQVVGLRRDQC